MHLHCYVAYPPAAGAQFQNHTLLIVLTSESIQFIYKDQCSFKRMDSLALPLRTDQV